MEQTALFYRFGVALAIGLLVGLQREFAYGGQDGELFAGVRTFALMGLVGCTAAFVADTLGSSWGFVSVVTAMGALIVVAHLVGAWRHDERGLTTETATLLTILAGALCYWDHLELAAALAVMTTALLSLKPEMHAFARRISREDMYATLKFAAITAIVLPILPNRTFGPPPFDALNPYKIWIMVVFISGISFLGYVLIKLVGPRQGIGLAGLLGGFVASTPLTLSFSHRSREDGTLAKPLALAIIVAWTVMFPRVAVEVAVLNPAILPTLSLPLAAMAAVGLGYCVYLYLAQHPEEEEEISFSNPFELGPALKFGLLYAVVLLVSKAAQMYLGDKGIYISSVLAGLTDADAITLSIAELSRGTGGLAVRTASRALVLGAMSNTAAKGGIALASGSPSLRRALLPGFLLMLLTGVGVTFLI
jgi:uncharacterized membrane protein (DUF4010 family)